jgi:hypothetical protein
MADTPVDVGGGDTSSEDPVLTNVNQDLDDWALEGDKQAEKSESRPRQSNGKFAKGSGDARQVADAIKATVQQGSRPAPKPARMEAPAKVEQPEEPEEEEAVEPEEEAPEEKPRRKVKGVVNGEETEIDIDDEEFQKLNAVQMAKASQKAFREAAEMRKEATQLKQALETARDAVGKDPMALFKALGIPEDKVFEFAQQKALEKVYETIDPNTGQPYTPEQQRIIQLQKELGQKQRVEEEAKQKEEAVQFEKMKEVVRADVDRKFTAALKETGLPPTPYTMMRLANLMEQMGPEVDPQLVAPMVMEDVVTEIVHTINTIPIETAVELLGENFMKALRKHDIDKSRASKDKFGRNIQKFPGNAPTRQPTKTTHTTDPDEASDYLEKWARGK